MAAITMQSVSLKEIRRAIYLLCSLKHVKQRKKCKPSKNGILPEERRVLLKRGLRESVNVITKVTRST